MSETEEMSWLQLLSSSIKSEQNLGMEKLKIILLDLNKVENPDDTEIISYLHNSCRDYPNLSTPDKITVLTVGFAFLTHASRSVINLYEKNLCSNFQNHALSGLSTDNAQLRNISGTFLGALCQKLGHHIFAELKPSILKFFHELNKENTKIMNPTKLQNNNESTSSSTPPSSPIHFDESSAQIFKDTASWKCLDTWICCLQKIAMGCGPAFAQFVDLELSSCISSSLDNRERFVRESCCVLMKIIIVHCQLYHYWQEQLQTGEQCELIIEMRNKFIDLILKGMSDSWADVRLPACVAAREYINSTKSGIDDNYDEETLNRFLPALCFNRYSTAIGLQRYSQETWMIVTKGQGKKKIEENFENVFSFYKSQILNGNSECKEMACHCFNESVKKLGEQIVSPKISEIFNALKSADVFRDALWSTRDAACLLSFEIIEKYKRESTEHVEYLIEEMFILLEDLAPHVRESSASVLSSIVKNYEEQSGNLVTKITEKIHSDLKNIKIKYKEMEAKSSKEDKKSKSEFISSESQSQIGVIKNTLTTNSSMPLNTSSNIREILSSTSRDADANSNMRPKITFMGFPTGISSACYAKRNVEPWEIADGCICLLRKLSAINSPSVKNQLTTLIPDLAESANVQNYHQRPFYIQTLLKQLPEIYEGLGKICLKRSIELFFDVIIEYYMDTDGSFAPTHHAAVECLDKLGQQLGKSILKQRLVSYDSVFADKFIKF